MNSNYKNDKLSPNLSIGNGVSKTNDCNHFSLTDSVANVNQKNCYYKPTQLTSETALSHSSYAAGHSKYTIDNTCSDTNYGMFKLNKTYTNSNQTGPSGYTEFQANSCTATNLQHNNVNAMLSKDILAQLQNTPIYRKLVQSGIKPNIINMTLVKTNFNLDLTLQLLCKTHATTDNDLWRLYYQNVATQSVCIMTGHIKILFKIFIFFLQFKTLLE